MILGIGTDIVENRRIERLWKRYGDLFLSRIFTEEEIRYSLSHSDPVPHLAARFAVKEAAVKALNLIGNHGIRLRDVEVSGRLRGKKKLVLSGITRSLADRMGACGYHLSLSHTKHVSMAVVVFEGKGEPGRPAAYQPLQLRNGDPDEGRCSGDTTGH